METKKQMLEIDKKNPMTAALSDEHQRRWDDKRWETKLNDPERNYDKSRVSLNFEVRKDRNIAPIDLTKRINEKVDERIFGWKSERLDATGKEPIVRSCQHKSVNIIMGGNRERMLELAFGNQALRERGHNSGIKRMHEIEQWALDAYDWACRQFGKENVVSFIVHCDETNPHAHCVVVPILPDGRLCAKEMFGGKDKIEASKRLRFLHSNYAEVNAKWGLERGDDIRETGAEHKSLEEHNRELLQTNKTLDKMISQKDRALKGLTTMLRNLEREKSKLERQIADLEKELRESGEQRNDLQAKLKELRLNLYSVRNGIIDKTKKLDEVKSDLEKMKEQINQQNRDSQYLKDYQKELATRIGKDITIILKASILDVVLQQMALICREVPAAAEMAEDTFIDDRDYMRFDDVLNTARRVFVQGLNGATSMAPSSGGGGSTSDMPWRERDEDYLHWARRAMQYAHAKHYPGNKLRKSRGY